MNLDAKAHKNMTTKLQNGGTEHELNESSNNASLLNFSDAAD